MKFIYPLLIVLFILGGCSKNGNGPVTPPQPVYLDTLTAGWSKTASDTSFGVISDIYFVDNNTGYFASSKGIYKSSTSGSSWSLVYANIGPNSFFNIAAYAGGKAAFVKGDNSILITNDAGLTFTNIPVSGTTFIGDVFFASSQVCYASALNNVLKSSNAGVSFSPVLATMGYNFIYSVYFVNESTGWTLRSPNLYKTSDGGASWAVQKTTAPTNRSGAIYFKNESNGFFTSEDSLFRTINGGANWELVFTLPNTDFTFFDVAMVSDNIVYISAGKSIYKSADGGTTWQRVVRLGNSELVELHFTDANHGWACGANGSILKFVQ
jgi:photosystem II stability/assembly factor-like uncharacterized protein